MRETKSDDKGPSAFFNAMRGAFAATITARRNQPDLAGALCAQAFDSFERNAEIQAEGAPALACRGECEDCCTLRVVATAPELFLVARFVTVNAPAFRERGRDLIGDIARMDADVGGFSEERRLALRRMCPFIERGLCLAYRVRPLACRGHASFSRESCIDAISGGSAQAEISTPHLVVRSLVQNAMMSALRDAGLVWRLYELNRALNIAIATPTALALWISGEDPLAAAAIGEFDLAEAAAAFDAIAAG
jgi:hypothetical protein